MKALAAALLTACPAAAHESGLSVNDLGALPDRPACMGRAIRTVERFIRETGGGSFTTDTWMVYLWDAQPGVNDAVIMCPILGDGVNAFVVVHGLGEDPTEQTVRDRLTDMWDTTN
ncbi:MAG: hypothetical protein ACU0BS_09735 [Hasllibacter sp.]